MLFKCSVVNCKGNYKDGPKVSVFRFPKDPEIANKWSHRLMRKDFQPSSNSRLNQKLKMVECCKPFHCRFLDGLLAVFYICVIIGGSVLLSILYLDEEMNEGHCLILNLNSSITKIDIPEQFNHVVCQGVKYIAISQITIPLFLIMFNWVFGFSAFLGWWVFQSLLISVQSIISLIIGVGFTTTLLIFCGQLYWATKEAVCVVAATIYDSEIPYHGKYTDKVQLTFDHVVVAVASSWFIFFSLLFAAFILLVHTCTRYYQTRMNKLERTAEDLRLAVHHENLRNQTEIYSRSAYEMPPAYISNDFEPQLHPEDEPLIRF